MEGGKGGGICICLYLYISIYIYICIYIYIYIYRRSLGDIHTPEHLWACLLATKYHACHA